MHLKESNNMSGSNNTITVPDLGGAESVEVIEISVNPGDQIQEGDALIVVESDKASMDIPSPQSGTVKSIIVTMGGTVSEGDAILELETSGMEEEVDSQPQINDTTEPPSDHSIETAESSDNVVEITPVESGEPVLQTQTVVIPDLGGADSVEVIEILVAEGDQVQEGDGLLVMESDKASMDMPSPSTGVIEKIIVTIGQTVTAGDLAFEIQANVKSESPQLAPEQEHNTDKPVQQTSAKPQVPGSETPQAASTLTETKQRSSNVSKDAQDVYAGPAVRKLARELGVDLLKVEPSGPKNRVAKEDLHSYVKSLVSGDGAGSGLGIPQVPDVDFAQFGEVEIQAMSKLHKLTAQNMQRSWLNVPHVTQYDDADITDLEVFRASLKPEMEKRGIKISPLPFILKAVALALKENPAFNASLDSDGESIVYKKYVNIGMAVDTEAGLFVPVLRDVDQKGLWQIAEEVIDLATRAKQRKLKPNEMQGACFTISSLGGIGGRGFTPIVNTPEVGILGVSKLTTQPVFKNGNFEPRKMLPLSLSYDHRAVNGGDAGRFLTFVVEQLSDTRRLIL